jgi:predicted membrane channel-forming protein YqfA (hemolysin III family)
MSTLDVTCGRCGKSFRVRAEFAGRATRCPGCSAPLTIGGAAAAPPPREPDERPRPRPKDDDDRPRRVTGNWKPVDTALGREQSALVCLLLQVGCLVLAFCLGQLAGRALDGLGPLAVIPFAILVGGPALAALVFGISARVAATGSPAESLTRGTARSSLILSFLALGCLALFALSALATLDTSGGRPDELPLVVSMGGVILTGLASVVTFAAFVAQVGIARRSVEVNRSVGRLVVAATVCTIITLGIGALYTVANVAFAPSPSFHTTRHGGYYSYPNHDDFYRFVVFGLVPLSGIVMLILYHRLLAAARRSIQREDT